MRDEAAAAKATTIAADFSDEDGPEMAKPARVGQARQRSWHGAARGGRGVALGALRRAARTACIGRGNAAPALFARRSTQQPQWCAPVRDSERRSAEAAALVLLARRCAGGALGTPRPRLAARSAEAAAAAALFARCSTRRGAFGARRRAAPSTLGRRRQQLRRHPRNGVDAAPHGWWPGSAWGGGGRGDSAPHAVQPRRRSGHGAARCSMRLGGVAAAPLERHSARRCGSVRRRGGVAQYAARRGVAWFRAARHGERLQARGARREVQGARRVDDGKTCPASEPSGRYACRRCRSCPARAAWWRRAG